MSSRVEKMILLARKQAVPQSDKNTVDLTLKNVSVNDISKEHENINTKQWASPRGKENSSDNFSDKCDQFFIPTFFEPVVKNETKLSDQHYPLDILKPLFDGNKDVVEHIKPLDSININFDDFVKDPHIELPNDSEMGEMGLDIEMNLMQEIPDGRSLNGSRIVKKEKRNRGQSYVTKSGRTIEDRKFFPLDTCKKKCASNVTIEEQRMLFSKYWSLGSYNKRVTFIMALVIVQNKKTCTVKLENKASKERQYSNSYYLDISGKRINVCQRCFRKCFCETESFIRSVIEKKINFPQVPFRDLRGAQAPANKFDETKLQEFKNHINSFPAYESHYTRRDTSVKYLPSDLTLSRMYSLYREKYNMPSSLSKYSEIFHGMNLKFKHPKADTCNNCDLIKAKIDIAIPESPSMFELEEQQRIHLLNADNTYKSKEKDKLLSVNQPTHKTLAFDLEQCLPTPYLRTSVSFYKRQLWTYNLTVHDCSDGSSHCFMWHEAIAKRGGNEIGSCLFKYLSQLTADGMTKTAIFYSDSCAGQNKNRFVAVMFMSFITCFNNNIDEINHKFLVPGHTHMECDVDHSVIERKRKKSTAKIHHPRDWYNFVRTAKTRNPFKVVEMSQSDFFDFSALSKYKFTWRCIDEDSNKFVWNEIKWLRYKRDNFGIIEYKTTLDENEPFKRLNIRKRGINEVLYNNLKLAHKELLPISSEKKKDLMDMLPLIDPCFHTFYENLTTTKEPTFHPDLTEGIENE